MRTMFAAALLSVALIAGGCGGSSSSETDADGATAAAQAYIDALAERDFRTACSYFNLDGDPPAILPGATKAQSSSAFNLLECEGTLRHYSRGATLEDLRFAELSARADGDASWVRADGSVAPIADQIRVEPAGNDWVITELDG